MDATEKALRKKNKLKTLTIYPESNNCFIIIFSDN